MEISNIPTSVVGQTAAKLDVKSVDSTLEAKLQAKPTQPSPQEALKPDAIEDVIETVAAVNQQLDSLGRGVMFSVDQSTNSSVVKVIDKSTEEVLKQFPSEGSLKIMANIQRYLETVQNSGSVAGQGLTGTLLSEII